MKFLKFRLAEGHAKLMYRTEVLMMDAIFAAHLINLTNDTSKESCKFPTDATATYQQEGTVVTNTQIKLLTVSHTFNDSSGLYTHKHTFKICHNIQ